MSRRFVLDSAGENAPPPGLVCISDQVAFLRHADGQESLFIQGDSVTQWAADFARARGIPIERLASPSRELLDACPDLTLEQAQSLVPRLGSLDGLVRPLRSEQVAERLWPEEGFWGSSPGAWHGLSWLLWRSRAVLADAETPIAAAISNRWANVIGLPLARAYRPSSSESAWQLVHEWLGLKVSDLKWPTVDLDLMPTWAWERLREEWVELAIATKAGFFADLLRTCRNVIVLREAASVVGAFFSQNPAELSEPVLDELKPFMQWVEWQRLASMVPPPDPGDPPDSLPDAIEWFVAQYLPWRTRGRADDPESHQQRVEQLGRAFGEWFIHAYADAVTGGPGSQSLGWIKSAGLDNERESVTLLVILDGMLFTDAEQLWRDLVRMNPRMSLDDFGVAVSPLPTVTEFAKRSVRHGCSPVHAFEETGRERVLPRDRDSEVTEALAAARPGEIVVWSLREPDHTYHSPADADTIRIEVAGRLSSTARRLSEVLSRTPGDRLLRLVLTTDHGRLMGSAQRSIDVPSGYQDIQGRAAWGDLQPPSPFGLSGVVVAGDLAYLHPDRFYLPSVCAVALGHQAFKKIDGRGGTELFPHGGVFPEEVLIPWVELTRDREPPRPKAALVGKSVAGTEGEGRLTVVNRDRIRFRIVRIEVGPDIFLRDVAFEVPPLAETVFLIHLPAWPNSGQAAGAVGKLTIELMDGRTSTSDLSLQLEVEELYRTDDILGDF